MANNNGNQHNLAVRIACIVFAGLIALGSTIGIISLSKSAKVKLVNPPVWVDNIAVGKIVVSTPAALKIGSATVILHLPKHDISCIVIIRFCLSIIAPSFIFTYFTTIFIKIKVENKKGVL